MSQKPVFFPILRLNEGLRPFGLRMELVHTHEGELLGLSLRPTGETTDRPSQTQYNALIDALDLWTDPLHDVEDAAYERYTAPGTEDVATGRPHEQQSGRERIDNGLYGLMALMLDPLHKVRPKSARRGGHEDDG